MYLQSALQAVTLLLHGLFHGSSCFHPQTLVLQPSCAARSPPLSSADMRNSLCSNTYNFLDLSPCRSIAFLLTVGIELTANQCQSVCVKATLAICQSSSTPPLTSIRPEMWNVGSGAYTGNIWMRDAAQKFALRTGLGMCKEALCQRASFSR